MIYFTYIEIAGSEYAIELTYDYFPKVKGKRERGIPVEPDEAAFTEVSGVKLDISCDGEASEFVPVKLPQAVTEQLEEETLIENH